jgi:ABC-2 type transport system ATP-binding protein
MIEARGLTKRYGDKVAVDDLSFTVRPGRVTGFLGPNGAGKSTTMRLILGLDTPTRGAVTVNGRPYREHVAPLREVGALLEARSIHPSRGAYRHLLALAQTCGIPRARVEEVIDAVGLRDVARRRAGGFSLGMGQRLGIATALLGDPRTVILDEPLNGLDTEGIRWIRSLLRGLAAEGKTVFVSSHLMNEMALTAEHLIVIGKGRLIADTGVAEFIARSARDVVRVRTTAPDALAALLRSLDTVSPTTASPTTASPTTASPTTASPTTGEAADVTISRERDGALTVSGLSTDQIGTAAGAAGITLLELTARQTSLEDAFVDMTKDAVEFRTSPTPTPVTPTSAAVMNTGAQR